MTGQRRSELYVGITVFTAILMLVVAILWGKGVKIAGETQVLTMKFDRVGGLATGDAANVSGVQVGRVTSVEIVGDSVRVKAKVSGSIDIRADAVASIQSAELMGGKLVEIKPGSASEPLGEDASISGSYAPGIGEVASTFGTQAAKVSAIMEDIKTVTQRLKSLFASEEETQTIQSALRHIAATSQRLDSLLLQNADALQSSITNLEHSTSLLNNFLSSEQERAHRLLQTTEQLANNLQVLADSTQKLVNAANSSGSSVGRILQSDSLYMELRRSIHSFDSLMTDLRENPDKYLNEVKFKVGLF